MSAPLIPGLPPRAPARVLRTARACAINPLKMSAPVGAALAFLGMDRALPLLHGAQGCTAFGLVLFVRHFRETIPLQTTAMSEVSTILGGMDNIEAALKNIWKRAQPELVGLVSTGLTETKGEDLAGVVKLIRERNPELAPMTVVPVSTPDYVGAFQDGWGAAVLSLVETVAVPCAKPEGAPRINILPGSHLTVADLDEIRDLVEAFGLTPVIAPDLSGSLDGHIPDSFKPHTLGGATMADIRQWGGAIASFAIGEQMRPAAEALEARTGVPSRVFAGLTGLEAVDDFVAALSRVSGVAVPARVRRQRSQLLDALLDAHFYFGGKRVAVAAEPDLLHAFCHFVTGLGAEVAAAVTSTDSPLLPGLPCAEVVIGDLMDLEDRAAGCDLIATHSHGRQAAERLDIPLHRIGIPQFDRLGGAHRLSVGYRGSRALAFDLANQFMSRMHEPKPGDFALPEPEEAPCACAG